MNDKIDTIMINAKKIFNVYPRKAHGIYIESSVNGKYVVCVVNDDNASIIEYTGKPFTAAIDHAYSELLKHQFKKV